MNSTKKKLPELSVFMPAYNEAANIEEAVKQVLAVAPRVAKKFEVIVVNDGSKDCTYQIAKRLASKHKQVRVVTQKNRGYGGALKRGFKTAKYEWVFFTDSDLQFDMEELASLVEFTDDYELILGYRKNRAEGKKRALIAKALKVWNKVFLNFPLRIKDIDCAFKLIHKRVLTQVGEIYSDGAMVSTELLLKAYRSGVTFKQVGVTHYKRRAGSPTGNNFKVIMKAVRDTFTLQKIFVEESVMGRLVLNQMRRLAKGWVEFAEVLAS